MSLDNAATDGTVVVHNTIVQLTALYGRLLSEERMKTANLEVRYQALLSEAKTWREKATKAEERLKAFHDAISSEEHESPHGRDLP